MSVKGIVPAFGVALALLREKLRFLQSTLCSGRRVQTAIFFFDNEVKLETSSLGQGLEEFSPDEGLLVIPNFIDAEYAATLKNRVERAIFEKPTFVQHRDDQRLFGLEAEIGEIGMLLGDHLVSALSEYCCGRPLVTSTVMGNVLESGRFGSSGGGWHRDTLFPQAKWMLYLTDVGNENGPLEVVPGTEKFLSKVKASFRLRKHRRKTRFTDAEVSSILQRAGALDITGKAGTLIVFNSSMVHRGRPICSGLRVALTGYLLPNGFNDSSIPEFWGPNLRFPSSANG